MNIDRLLREISEAYRQILGDRLVGIYVHGSIAFGCFDPRVSDIDFLVVVDRPISLQQKTALIEVLLSREPHAPPKGFEMSVVLRGVCDPFVYPTPYELHYSAAYAAAAREDLVRYCEGMHGIDRDLAAHVTVTRAVGLVLCGKPIGEVFGEVPREDYLDSIRFDVENAAEDISEHPVYVILNLCRVAAFLREGLVISKKDGGAWGSSHLPAVYRPVIRSALYAYTEGRPYEKNESIEQKFAAMMLAEIFA
ncbi:MAG: DUF4111 domain-containing protein [Clostridia bacterium]|nr:DUF4111 domain-containing protein [Clostridia bacterium]